MMVRKSQYLVPENVVYYRHFKFMLSRRLITKGKFSYFFQYMPKISLTLNFNTYLCSNNTIRETENFNLEYIN